jgi:chaperonin GroES
MVEKLRPLGDRVLVKRVASEDMTPSGLFIPDSAKETAQTGTVVAVGSGRKDKDGRVIAVDVLVNDTIFFGKYAGTEAGDYLIIREDEILGVVQK